MPRKKTAKSPVIKLKSGVVVFECDSASRLRDKHFIGRAIIECFQDGDAEAFKEILSAHLDVIDKSKFSKRIKVSERALSRMVSKNGNPTLNNIFQIMRALCT